MPKSPAPPRRPWDWPAAILVFLMVQVASSRLGITGWTPYLYFTQSLGAMGVILGLALGYSNFRPRAVRWLALLYSLVILPWQMVPAIEAEASFSERLATVGGRLLFSAGEFFARKPVEDPLFFVALVSLGFWIIGLTAGYALARHNNTLGALLPAGVATLIIQLYDGFAPVRIWALALYVFLALLFVGRNYLRQNRQFWDDQRVFVTSESTQDIARSLLMVAAVTVFLAWSLPTSISSLKNAATNWERFARPIRERLSNAVTSLDSPYGAGSQGDFYSDSLTLGRNAAVGDTPVFTVEVNTLLANRPPRFYWRGRVYDTYRNGQWITSSSRSQEFDPKLDQLTLPPVQAAQEEVRTTFTLQLARQGLIYTPADPFWVNRPGAFYSTLTAGRGEDISAWMADPILSGGDRYQVLSLAANPAIEDLQAAGTEYPTWVRQRYIDSPDAAATLKALAPLALQITEGQETPYDKAQAITLYLRNEIEYQASMATPPRGMDPVLWVLNDYKKGFCMYSASAEVLMLRSLGIPARMTVGFAQGRQDPVTGIYSVLKQDAHAWPEVYFPGIGWVEFEPTGNQDPLVRPNRPLGNPTPIGGSGVDGGLLNQDQANDAGRGLEEGFTNAPAAGTTSANNGLLAGLGLLLVGILIAANQRFGLVERLPGYISESYKRSGIRVPPWIMRWERWTHLSSIERSFHAVNYSLRALGKPQAVHITPSERAAVLKGLLPSAASYIETLLHEHQLSLYTASPGVPALARSAAWKLIGQTLRARFQEAWKRFDRRFDSFG